METIYDHGVTEQELTALFGSPDERMDQVEYDEFVGPDSACAHLYLLFRLRGDTAAACAALNKIRDPAYRVGIKTPFCRPSNNHETRSARHNSQNRLLSDQVELTPFAIGWFSRRPEPPANRQLVSPKSHQ